MQRNVLGSFGFCFRFLLVGALYWGVLLLVVFIGLAAFHSIRHHSRTEFGFLEGTAWGASMAVIVFSAALLVRRLLSAPSRGDFLPVVNEEARLTATSLALVCLPLLAVLYVAGLLKGSVLGGGLGLFGGALGLLAAAYLCTFCMLWRRGRGGNPLA